MKLSTNALIVFVKNPIWGKVKTRLAATIGHEKALSVYQKLLKHTFSVAENVHSDLIIFYSDFLGDDVFSSPYKVKKYIQTGNNLGEKMKNAFNQVFQLGYSSIIIIGSDCPKLSPQHITQAFSILKNNDFVFGPADDGGYYLMGSNLFFSPVFENKPWSTSSVLSQTLNDLQQAQLAFELIEKLNDIDNYEDLKAFYNDPSCFL